MINAVLLRPLPYPDPDRLMIVTESDAEMPSISVSFPDYLDWKKENTVFENIAVARGKTYNLSGLEGREPEQIPGAVVTANFFEIIGLKPQLGRVFTEAEDRVGGPALAVISDQLWQRLFQRDPAVLGRSLDFAGEFYTVIGVMPPQMFSPRRAEVWFPLRRHATGPGWTDRENHPGFVRLGAFEAGRFDRNGPRTDEDHRRESGEGLSKIEFPRRHDNRAIASRIRSANIAPASGCFSLRLGSCFSSPASISPIFSPLVGLRGRVSSRCARPSAPRAGGSFGNSSSKV